MAEENRNQDGREERELQPAAHTPGDISMEAAPVPTGEDAVRTETANGEDAARGRTAAASRKTARKRHSAGKTAQKKERAGAGKKKKAGWVYNVGIAVCACVFLVCAFLLGRWMYENYKTKQISDSLAGLAGVVAGMEGKGIAPMDDDDGEDAALQYLDVNLEELVAKNPDTVGWIRVNGTKIDYPVVQTNDNEYYLKRDFEGNYTQAGWIFADYRNNFDKLANNRNTILYGHGRRDMSMFGSIEYCREDWWQERDAYHIVRLTTLNEQSVWRVFAVFTTSVDFNYIQTTFANDEEFLNMVGQMQDKSFCDFGVDVGADDRIITLSTCTDDADRLVLCAKLIKSDVRTPAETQAD